MNAGEVQRDNMAHFLIDEYSKHKHKNTTGNFHDTREYSQEFDTGSNEDHHTHSDILSTAINKLFAFVFFVIGKLIVFILLYIKTFIELSCKFSWETIKFIASLYRPSITFIDKYFVIVFRYLFSLLNKFSYRTEVWLYKYGVMNKYYKVNVGEQKYSDIDIARMASGIGEFESLTLQAIQERFHVKYHTAMRIRDMRNDGLKMLGLLKQSIDELRNK